MLAISIRQPWAWLILRPDVTDPIARARLLAAGQIKTIENWNWATKYRGRVLIHAAKGMTRDEYADAAMFAHFRCGVPQVASFASLLRGGIVGAAEIVDCVNSANSPWFVGEHGFVLRDARPLPFFACRGKLGFFKPEGYQLPAPLNEELRA